MIAPFAWAGMVADQMPSPARASPLTPSSCMAMVLNVPPLVESMRHLTLAVMLAGVSSLNFAVDVTGSVGFGTRGGLWTIVALGSGTWAGPGVCEARGTLQDIPAVPR